MVEWVDVPVALRDRKIINWKWIGRLGAGRIRAISLKLPLSAKMRNAASGEMHAYEVHAYLIWR